ncbi:hypothetical protein BDZ91DRAFT_731165 [Kalaharituber pfeilii]|nr:hypothetical protein BDZ91DRAFT_731165 [Kalaharituber pfeilii]
MLPCCVNAAILRECLLPRCYGTHVLPCCSASSCLPAEPLFCFGQRFLSSSHFGVK